MPWHRFVIDHVDEDQSGAKAPHSKEILFAWCLNVDVDVLSSSTSEYSSSKHVQPHQYDEHKNHDYGYHSDIGGASAFFGHNGSP